MSEVYLKVPSIDELHYRQEWMKDTNTMSYNKDYDIDLKGYDKNTGTISKTEEEMINWYNNWINKEPDKFFSYIYIDNIEEPIGEVYYYLENDKYNVGILIQDKYRGKGYSYEALLKLLEVAFQKNNINELVDYFPKERINAYKLFTKAGFIYQNNKVVLSKDRYNKLNNYYKTFRNNFTYVSREENTLKSIINNPDNIIIEEKNNNNLMGFSIINKNTILLLFVYEQYRNNGIGSILLNKSEQIIKENGYDKVILGAGYDYLMPGVPTSKKYTTSINEELNPLVNDKASNFFENKGYIHSWGECNCFDMKMNLSIFNHNEYSVGDTINDITYRWANINDIDDIVECADDSCQYQDEKFSKYYKNTKLYEENNNQRVLVAIKQNKIVGSLIVSIETEAKDLGCVGCTCVLFKETHQGIGTNLVKLGTKYLKDIGLNKASLSYTYTGLDKLYGYSGYKISTYYFMGEKILKKVIK